MDRRALPPLLLLLAVVALESDTCVSRLRPAPLASPELVVTPDSDAWVDASFHVQASYARVLAVSASGEAPRRVRVPPLESQRARAGGARGRAGRRPDLRHPARGGGRGARRGSGGRPARALRRLRGGRQARRGRRALPALRRRGRPGRGDHRPARGARQAVDGAAPGGSPRHRRGLRDRGAGPARRGLPRSLGGHHARRRLRAERQAHPPRRRGGQFLAQPPELGVAQHRYAHGAPAGQPLRALGAGALGLRLRRVGRLRHPAQRVLRQLCLRAPVQPRPAIVPGRGDEAPCPARLSPGRWHPRLGGGALAARGASCSGSTTSPTAGG